ncbi:MAG: C40 family peptidase [Bacteroidia bacterium]|nr:C40 family peptidase [Bacteroidia bacterium]MDW8014568.1 C40 family peptidase [Bacteroidia bacterium]
MGEWMWIPRHGIVPLRAEPSHRSEQVSELLWGEPQQILDTYKNWVFVRGHLDGYSGWIEAGTLFQAYYDGSGWSLVQWRQAPLFHHRRQIGWVPLGSLFPASGRWLAATGEYTVHPTALMEWHLQGFHLQRWLPLFRGTPYRWGGKTPWGIDCSGFTQLLYRLTGRLLPRDAYQQAEITLAVKTPQVGDLVFFTSQGMSPISHVGLYIGESTLLHATPAQGISQVPLHHLYTHSFHSFRTYVAEDFVI